MDLFDYIKVIFSRNKKDWNSVSTTDKSRNHFMLNRYMSINFPIQANELNRLQINSKSVANYWHSLLSSKFIGIPSWIYTKTKKEKVKKEKEFSDNVINYWYDLHDFNKRDFLDYKKFYPDDLEKELKEIEKFIKNNK